jgi:hypothetical protein
VLVDAGIGFVSSSSSISSKSAFVSLKFLPKVLYFFGCVPVFPVSVYFGICNQQIHLSVHVAVGVSAFQILLNNFLSTRITKKCELIFFHIILTCLKWGLQ